MGLIQRKSQPTYDNNCICFGITLRQWSIIISILFAVSLSYKSAYEIVFDNIFADIHNHSVQL